MPQIYDMGPTALLPLRRKACWGFFRPKNPTASTGFEPANLATKGQHATPRPPKLIVIIIIYQLCIIIIIIGQLVLLLFTNYLLLLLLLLANY